MLRRGRRRQREAGLLGEAGPRLGALRLGALRLGARLGGRLPASGRFGLTSRRVLLRRAGGAAEVAPATVEVDAASGTILRVDRILEGIPAAREGMVMVDLGDRMLLPGLVDAGFWYVAGPQGANLRRGDVERSTRLAAEAGITTLVDSPVETLPVELSLAVLTKRIAALREARLFVDVGTLARVNMAASVSQTAVLKLLRQGALGVMCSIQAVLSSGRVSGRVRLSALLNTLAQAGAVLVADGGRVARPLFSATTVDDGGGNDDDDRENLPANRSAEAAAVGSKSMSHGLQAAREEHEWLPPEDPTTLSPEDDEVADAIFGGLRRGAPRRTSSAPEPPFPGDGDSAEDDERSTLHRDLLDLRRRYLIESLKARARPGSLGAGDDNGDDAEGDDAEDDDADGDEDRRSSSDNSRRTSESSFGFSPLTNSPRFPSGLSELTPTARKSMSLPRSVHSCGNMSAGRSRPTPSPNSSAGMMSSLRSHRRSASLNIRHWRLDRDETCSDSGLLGHSPVTPPTLHFARDSHAGQSEPGAAAQQPLPSAFTASSGNSRRRLARLSEPELPLRPVAPAPVPRAGVKARGEPVKGGDTPALANGLRAAALDQFGSEVRACATGAEAARVHVVLDLRGGSSSMPLESPEAGPGGLTVSARHLGPPQSVLADAWKRAQAPGGPPFERLVDALTAVPAAALGLERSKGAIAPGLCADLVILSTDGGEATVEATLCRGVVVHERGERQAEGRPGIFLAPTMSPTL